MCELRFDVFARSLSEAEQMITDRIASFVGRGSCEWISVTAEPEVIQVDDVVMLWRVSFVGQAERG